MLIKQRHYIGLNPVKLTVFTAVLNQSHPGFIGFKVIPQIGECRFWHILMADNIVVLTDQFFTAEAGNLTESVISIGDSTIQIGGGYQANVLSEGSLSI